MLNKLLIVVATSLLSASVYANEVSFDDMDTNGDGKVTKDEFHGSMADAGTYSNYDTDGDGYLSEDEFSETNFDDASYGDWDANSDGLLDDNEYYDGSFNYYDENEDGHWQSGEWDDAGDDGFWDV